MLDVPDADDAPDADDMEVPHDVDEAETVDDVCGCPGSSMPCTCGIPAAVSGARGRVERCWPAGLSPEDASARNAVRQCSQQK
jgi:hypothetical protein